MVIVHKFMHAKSQLDHTCWFEKAGDDKGATGSSADPLMLKVNHGRSVGTERELMCESGRCLEQNIPTEAVLRIQIFPSRILEPVSKRFQIPGPDPHQRIEVFLTLQIVSKLSEI